MKIYKGWKYTVVTDKDTGISTYDIFNEDGIDWYKMMVELDDRDLKWVIGVKDGFVNWATTKSVNGMNSPAEGGILILTDDFPFPENTFGVRFDGEKFYKEEPVVRTKADIEADLLRLMAELKSIS